MIIKVDLKNDFTKRPEYLEMIEESRTLRQKIKLVEDKKIMAARRLNQKY